MAESALPHYDCTYDGEGNQTTKTERSSGSVTTYAWNALHELTSATLPDGTLVSIGTTLWVAGSSSHHRLAPLAKSISVPTSSPSTTARTPCAPPTSQPWATAICRARRSN